MARPGYGKRSTPDQEPRNKDTFAHLATREAYIATYIDRLPEGAVMDIKTLAKDLPPFGQQAVSTALRKLSEAGHLRRVREPIGEGGTQWVFRTYFSRTPRDDAWWERFLTGEAVPGPESESDPKPKRTQKPPAYEALAAVGRKDARMALSAAECETLMPLADEWLARGASATELVYALTVGLPPVVHSPAALAGNRLTTKLPPEPAPTARPSAQRPRIMECTHCGRPGRPEALPGGLCRPCRGETDGIDPTPQARAEVRARVAQLRAALTV
ncbi:hypothetical protein FHS39_003371 [Streptomyces olivoverticillatus]|uniref:Uncharacterized protein n=1 Tax=Streptomyces olivoverticillatus TaxID=66427 RepID=A0A7W7LQW5_9ACTN|nr:hypothetical protein [Streptomyces olivoverticillatus]MBB4894337.1 hypothetical protein [Streptomyces olivoverticillatus]